MLKEKSGINKIYKSNNSKNILIASISNYQEKLIKSISSFFSFEEIIGLGKELKDKKFMNNFLNFLSSLDDDLIKLIFSLDFKPFFIQCIKLLGKKYWLFFEYLKLYPHAFKNEIKKRILLSKLQVILDQNLKEIFSKLLELSIDKKNAYNYVDILTTDTYEKIGQSKLPLNEKLFLIENVRHKINAFCKLGCFSFWEEFYYKDKRIFNLLKGIISKNKSLSPILINDSIKPLYFAFFQNNEEDFYLLLEYINKKIAFSKDKSNQFVKCTRFLLESKYLFTYLLKYKQKQILPLCSLLNKADIINLELDLSNFDKFLDSINFSSQDFLKKYEKLAHFCYNSGYEKKIRQINRLVEVEKNNPRQLELKCRKKLTDLMFLYFKKTLKRKLKIKTISQFKYIYFNLFGESDITKKKFNKFITNNTFLLDDVIFIRAIMLLYGLYTKYNSSKINYFTGIGADLIGRIIDYFGTNSTPGLLNKYVNSSFIPNCFVYDTKFNKEFLDKNNIVAKNIENFLQKNQKDYILSDGTEIFISRGTNIFENLLMGELVVGSCLQLASYCSRAESVLVNVVDINKGIYWIKTKNGEVLARVLVVISDKGNLFRFKMYYTKEPNKELDELFDDYMQYLSQVTGYKLGKNETESVSRINGYEWYFDGFKLINKN